MSEMSYIIPFMNKRHIVLVLGFVGVSLLPISVSAQATVQNNVSNGLQQQQSNAQATGNPLGSQNNTIQQNNSTEALSKVQQDSLGVVSNPSQTKPDVVVGAAQTTDKSDVSSNSNNGLIGLIAVIVVVVIVGIFWYYRRKPANQTTQVEAVKSKSTEATLVEPAPKKLKKKLPADQRKKKKKKKRAHR